MKVEPSYTTDDIATMLKISKLTVYDLIKKGELPAYRVGRQIRIDAEDFKAYKEKAKQTLHSESEMESEVKSEKPPLSISKKTEREPIQNLIITGQDVSLDILGKHIEKKWSDYRPLRANSGSLDSLISMYQGQSHLVSTHLFDAATGDYNTPYVTKILAGFQYIIFNLVSRKAGLYVQKNNPKSIKTWSDLTKDHVTFINREKGSGARILLDEQLKLHQLSADAITGYYQEETSHLGVSAVVANGDADVGVGTERAANMVGIDFIPLAEERVDLVILKTDKNTDFIKGIQDILNSTAFKNELQYIGGYDLSRTGDIILES